MYRPPVDNPLPDFRDTEERAEVARIIAVLAESHPAHKAHERGMDTISMTHLVADRPDLVKALIAAYFARTDRAWKKAKHFRP
jgi:hypothetical protein